MRKRSDNYLDTHRRQPRDLEPTKALPLDWKELQEVVSRWFYIALREPTYNKDSDVNIKVEYESTVRKSGHGSAKRYDIISGGSGFHQTLTLLAFLFGYRPTTILLDEPDAHLHVNLQREILDYFMRKSNERGTQFLIATHAEELVRGVDATQIVSLLSGVPTRILATPPLLKAMAIVANEEIVRLQAAPKVLYVEGASDELILRAWADACGAISSMDRFCFHLMGGGSKSKMKAEADEHFKAMQQIIPNLKRVMLFDYDGDATAFNPQSDNPTLCEWQRKNIENYLLVPDAWRRAVVKKRSGGDVPDLFDAEPIRIVDTFFSDQNLTLPPGRTWRDVSANIFGVVDGKQILFENDNSLFQILRRVAPPSTPTRKEVAENMRSDEIHEDVHAFMRKLEAALQTDGD